MTADEIKALLEAGIPDAEIHVEGEGSKYTVTVVTDRFE